MTMEITLTECRCANLPQGWPKCGRLAEPSSWAPGCAARATEEALRRLGFGSREEFIAWVAGFERRV